MAERRIVRTRDVNGKSLWEVWSSQDEWLASFTREEDAKRYFANALAGIPDPKAAVRKLVATVGRAKDLLAFNDYDHDKYASIGDAIAATVRDLADSLAPFERRGA